MNNSLFIVMIFWGVWIIIPVFFDGVLTLIYMLTILIKDPHRSRPHHLDPLTLPKVTVIIPTYNEEENINECLNYLKIQTYPQEKMEVIVVDNGSTDETSNIVKEQMKEIWQNQNTFGGILRLVVRYEKGKANALNTGIRLAKGEIIMNIDSRSFLAADAIYNMVAKFTEHPEYGAAMGTVEIDWNLLRLKDENGNYLLDANGHYIPRELSHKENFLGKGQFLEYLISFRIGRHFQDLTDSTYTLSGAFSAFKRDVLLKSKLYRSRTVTEDTDLTLDLQSQGVRIGYVGDAKAYLKPVLSMERFYGQRIRWHRGQIEVIGLHLDWYGNMGRKFWTGFWHNAILLIDHTFSFPRNIWIFLLPLFFLFGYSMNLIVMAICLMYAFYVFIDLLNAWFCYRVVDTYTKSKIKDTIQYCLVTPIFRLITFYFRFAAYLDVLKEPQAWSTLINPVRSIKGYRTNLQGQYQKTTNWGLKVWQFVSGQKIAPPVYDDEKIAEMDNYGMGVAEVQIDPNKSSEEVIFTQKKMDGIYKSYDYKER